MATFRLSASPANPATLAALERKIGFQFPGSFREFYLVTNGGKPTPNLFDLDGELLVVSEFFPVDDSENGLDRVCQDLKGTDGPLPDFLLPFADDPGGDYYCFSTRKDDYGTIWFFRAEYIDEPERAIRKICTGLNEFLNRLREDD